MLAKWSSWLEVMPTQIEHESILSTVVAKVIKLVIITKFISAFIWMSISKAFAFGVFPI